MKFHCLIKKTGPKSRINSGDPEIAPFLPDGAILFSGIIVILTPGGFVN